MCLNGTHQSIPSTKGPPPPDAHTISTSFLSIYYKVLTSHPTHLHKFYGQDSRLTHKDLQAKGDNGIGEIVMKLPLIGKEIKVNKVVSQESPEGGVMVVVEGEAEDVEFVQTFLLCRMEGPKRDNFYCRNDVLVVMNKEKGVGEKMEEVKGREVELEKVESEGKMEEKGEDTKEDTKEVEEVGVEKVEEEKRPQESREEVSKTQGGSPKAIQEAVKECEPPEMVKDDTENVKVDNTENEEKVESKTWASIAAKARNKPLTTKAGSDTSVSPPSGPKSIPVKSSPTGVRPLSLRPEPSSIRRPVNTNTPVAPPPSYPSGQKYSNYHTNGGRTGLGPVSMERMKCSVMVTGYKTSMPYAEVVNLLRPAFEKVGNVVRVDVRASRAFVEFASPEYAAKAVEAFASNTYGWRVEEKKVGKYPRYTGGLRRRGRGGRPGGYY